MPSSVRCFAGGEDRTEAHRIREILRTNAAGWRLPGELIYWRSCCSALFAEAPTLPAYQPGPRTGIATKSALRPGSSVVERGPEKAGVGGSIPSLATIHINNLAEAKDLSFCLPNNIRTSSNGVRFVGFFPLHQFPNLTRSVAGSGDIFPPSLA